MKKTGADKLDEEQKGRTFLELADKREHLEGYKVSNMLFNLATSHFAVNRNYQELVQGIDYIEGHLEIWDVKNRKLFNRGLREISRLLHNYLSSTFSLIRHNVKLCSELNKPELSSDYKKRVSELSCNQTISFVKDLRTFAQHIGLPILAAHFSLDNTTLTRPSATQSVTLAKETLLEWENWSNASREFIRCHENIDLKSVLKEYQDTITAFYTWFYNTVVNIYSSQLKELDEINRQLAESSPFKHDDQKDEEQKHAENWYCIWGCGFKHQDIAAVTTHELYCKRGYQYFLNNKGKTK